MKTDKIIDQVSTNIVVVLKSLSIAKGEAPQPEELRMLIPAMESIAYMTMADTGYLTKSEVVNLLTEDIHNEILRGVIAKFKEAIQDLKGQGVN